MYRKTKTFTGISKNQIQGYYYIAPWLIGFLLLTVYPFIISLFYSFTDFDMFTFKFVGLENYKEIFTNDDTFYGSLTITMIFTVASVIGKLSVALLCALFLTRKSNLTGFYRTAFYLPSIFGGSVSLAILWKYLFKTDGLINGILKVFSISRVNWLGSPDTALFTLILLPLWQMGSPMVIFIAALQTVPKELLEAARIDGAGIVSVFFKVKLPLISSVLLFNLIQQTISIIQFFTPAYIITQGGPIKATYLYSLMIYDVSFRNFRMGYASALSWILFVIMIVYTIILFRTANKWVFYEDGD